MASINDLATAAIASSSGPEQQPGTSPAPASSAARGAFIVLEGLDRSGKTTQVKLLEQRFVEEGNKVKVMSKQIQSLLAAGTTIVCDRYYHSGIVYSAAKQNPSLTLPWARAPERGLPRPDLVLFLDLTEEQARSRGGWGGEVYERSEMQRRVRELFWGLSMGGRDVTAQGLGLDEVEGWKQEEEDLVVVDAGGSVEEVAEEVWRKVKGRVEQVERGEVGRSVRVVR
ncbi:hypothetical protein CEP54_004574 [Fusarium duplospermum]|uniref:dTMP kinase n=1 Tax=Fusarium duplospermum TaxID=1325734 RepID=A0A428QHH6_9HYPO|nr:hypothetical protein CEP54_004574 [Fusarium duplospermum]